jgi:hypothetical protein
MIRSGLAVLAGIVVLTIASFAIEAVANPLVLRVFPDALQAAEPPHRFRRCVQRVNLPGL